MPTYDYRCRDCGHTFEVFQPMTARKLRKCPICGGKLERLLGTGAGIIFKGSGFYATDYRKPGYGEAKKKDAAPASVPAPDASKKSAKKESGD
ncbi:MAG TPA: zinc ribbon domain-containing protein [bacterium]|nr:zinc ribbon domain-containing protein [bacterium]HPQ66930.1 zinc ribbon domain-containing protein [bacterium]